MYNVPKPSAGWPALGGEGLTEGGRVFKQERDVGFSASLRHVPVRDRKLTRRRVTAGMAFVRYLPPNRGGGFRASEL